MPRKQQPTQKRKGSIGPKSGVKKATLEKIGRKKAHKKSTARAIHKRTKKREVATPETVQEKLVRFKKEHEENEELIITNTADDLQFFEKEGGGSLSVIEGLTLTESSGQKKGRSRRNKIEKSTLKNQPEEWENTRSKPEWNTPSNDYLPIKTLDGHILEAIVEDPNRNKKNDGEESDFYVDVEDEDEESEEAEKEQDLIDIENDDPEMVKVKLYYERQKKIQTVKEGLALLASQILVDPEHQIQKLHELRQRCIDESDKTIKKFILLSEVAIYKDIIPGYTIRLSTPEELATKVSKEVAQLRAYETSLLNAYQSFLRYLENQIRRAPKKFFSAGASLNNLGTIYTRCLATLLVSVPHFNFRSNLISTLVPLINVDNEQISDIAKEAIEGVFEQENQCDASLEATRKISSFVKAKNFRVKSKVISSFIKLPLTEELPEGTDILTGYTPSKRLSKRAKKKEKAEKQLQKDMKESMAEQDKQRRRQIQTDTLKTVFLVYFKILKNPDPGVSPLLPTVLQGLARFSHLINIDVLLNLLEILRDMMKWPTLDPMSKLHCSITAFQTLKTQGEALSVDLRDFFNHFYSMLFNIIPIVATDEALIPVVLRCFDLMFYDNKQLSLQRVAAFIKRLLMLSLYLSSSASIAIVAVVKNLFVRYPKTQQLLDNEYKGNGLYQPELDDPEHCNAFASSAWELSLLKTHIHSVLSHFSRLVCSMDTVEGNHSPEQLYHFYRPNDDIKTGGKGDTYCYPVMPLPQRHPFEKKVEREEKRTKSSKNAISKAWFVSEPPLRSPFFTELKEKENIIIKQLTTEMDHHQQGREEQKNCFQNYFEDLNSLTIIN